MFILNNINISILQMDPNRLRLVDIMVLDKNFAMYVINVPNVIYLFIYTRRNVFEKRKKQNY